jgi:hypothetical protein
MCVAARIYRKNEKQEVKEKKKCAQFDPALSVVKASVEHFSNFHAEFGTMAECLGTILVSRGNFGAGYTASSSPRLHFELPGPGYMIFTSGFGYGKHLPGSVGFLKGPAAGVPSFGHFRTF